MFWYECELPLSSSHVVGSSPPGDGAGDLTPAQKGLAGPPKEQHSPHALSPPPSGRKPAPHETQIRGPGTTPDLIGQHVGGKEADRPTLSSRDPDEAPDGLEGEEIYRADLLLKCVAA
ncbi:hypothetical protein R6Z07M_011900 [Ovis aries]